MLVPLNKFQMALNLKLINYKQFKVLHTIKVHHNHMFSNSLQLLNQQELHNHQLLIRNPHNQQSQVFIIYQHPYEVIILG